MPLTASVAWPQAATRLLIALCVSALLATALATGARPATAADVSGQISANRSYMAYATSAMLAQDRVLASIGGQIKTAKREMKDARASFKQLRSWYSGTVKMLETRRARLAEVEKRYGSAAEAPDPAEYKDRLRKLSNDVRDAIRQKDNLGPRLRSAERSYKAKRARLNALKRQRNAAISRQKGAEGALAARIVQMQRLAASLAESQSTISLTGGAEFSWPTTGKIVQTYGCTGFKLNPPRGSCRHFHDGIDIVDGYGTPIRTVAAGVVAYSGWNPWDEGARAWIVVVVHPDGFVSRYGHLIARKPVRAGEVVHTGQIVGRMGSTGKSTGTHLHFELLRGGADVNPLSYLPAGVMKINVDKTSVRGGRAAQLAKVKARAKAQAKARAKALAKARAAAARRPNKETPIDLPGPNQSACKPGTARADDAGASGSSKGSAKRGDCVALVLTASGDRHAAPVARPTPGAEGATSTEPGVPLPYRGASPTA